jgi:predicted deacylase
MGAGLGLSALTRRAGAEHPAEQRMLAEGTRFETPIYELRAERDGPTVMIVAGIHGNEPAPPRAACHLLALRLRRGRVVIVPEVNRPALAARTRFTPGETHGDLNRNFPTLRRPTARGALATALWDETVRVAPDWVLDLHEGWGYSAAGKSMGSSIVHTGNERSMADRLLARVNAGIDEPGKRFTLLEPGPAGSYARASRQELMIPSLVFETTWVEPMDVRVAQQLLLVGAALEALGVSHGSVRQGEGPVCPAR